MGRLSGPIYYLHLQKKWPEIDLFLSRKPGQKVEDRPDVVARVFKIKLDELLNDLKHGQHFGKVIAGIINLHLKYFLVLFYLDQY